MAELAVALIAAHIFADFGLQRATLVEWKSASVAGVIAHVAIYGLVTWLLLPVWSASLLSLALALVVAHGLIDLWKARGWPPYGRISPFASLALDQMAHLATLAAAVAVAARDTAVVVAARDAAAAASGSGVWLEPWAAAGRALGLAPGSPVIGTALAVAAAYVLAVPGGAVIVRSILQPYSRALPSESELSLGRVIGYLERLILLTLLLAGEYAAMAVIVAAKSLIRIPSIGGPAAMRSEPGDRGAGRARDGTARITTEYFLIGTLASIAVALLIGVAARAALAAL